MNPSTSVRLSAHAEVSGLRIGPIDLTQPSTWRGAAGLLAVFGMAVSPDLTNAIALALGALLSAIEIGRNEYAHYQAINRRESAKSADAALPALPALPVAAGQLRDALPPANDPTDDLPPPPGFSNR